MAWQIDNSHSVIGFSVRHMMLSKTRGEFQKFSGTVNLNEQNPAATGVDVSIDAGSINTRDGQRDGHLKSPDFLNVDAYPNMTFKSTNVELVDKTHAKLTGDLTIRDVTRPVTLDVEYTGQSKSPWGTRNVGFSAETKINRKDWGLTWNVALETGGVLVGDEVTVNIELELVEQA
ncbi:MAG: YceI family protein [Caldilineaceae bacterium]